MESALNNGQISAANSYIKINCAGYSTVMADIRGTWSGTINYEGSLDDINWYPKEAFNGVSKITSTTINQVSTMSTPAMGFIRVGFGAYTSGAAIITLRASTGDSESAMNSMSLAGTSNSVQGNAAHSASAVGNPVIMGGVVQSTMDATIASGDAAQIAMTTSGQVSVKPYGLPELDWQYTGTISGTSTQTIKAATAGLRNNLTDFSYQNVNLTIAATVDILDGSTVVSSFNAPALMANPVQILINTPKKPSVNADLRVRVTGLGTVIVNAGGYQSN